MITADDSVPKKKTHRKVREMDDGCRSGGMGMFRKINLRGSVFQDNHDN